MWNYEADVIIVGYGGAGATAALAAAKAGAKVLILEKNTGGGGNTKYSRGSIRLYVDPARAVGYIEILCEGSTERAVIETYVQESGRNLEWMRKLGGEPVYGNTSPNFPHSPSFATFPSIDGAESIGAKVRIKSIGAPDGNDLWKILSRHVAAANIDIVYSCPVHQLLTEKDVGIVGVAATVCGRTITARAAKAVILTCGGFEDDQNMHINYFGQKYLGLCTPGNQGDGVRLAQEVGADLWHMNAAAVTLGYKFPEFAFGIRHTMPSAGFIYVDQNARRFMDEAGTDGHLMWAPTFYIDTRTLRTTRIPSYVIFDEDTRMRGPLALTDQGRISDVYQWSRDNSVEISKGWINVAENLTDLARKINVPNDSLQTTVAQYNLQCVGGYDRDYGRSADTLVPLGRPPYYAMRLWPCLFNTQGGPKRNHKAQVLDPRGNPIKRLYSAGELGSLWHRYYLGAGNIGELLAFGRVAGRNAAAELSRVE